MAIGKRIFTALDGEYILKLWLELGSLSKVSRRLYSEGVVSPHSQKMYTTAALTLSTWRWCIRYPDKSYEMVRKYRMARGETLSQEQWKKELLSHARYCLNPDNYVKYLKGEPLVRNRRPGKDI